MIGSSLWDFNRRLRRGEETARPDNPGRRNPRSVGDRIMAGGSSGGDGRGDRITRRQFFGEILVRLHDWVYKSAKDRKQRVARSILLGLASAVAVFVLYVVVVTLPYSLAPILLFSVIGTFLWALVHA